MEETPVVQQTYGAWRPQKYFVTRGPLSGVVVLFVSVGLLIGRLRMNEKSLRNGISKFTRGSSRFYQSFKDQDAIMVNYDSIPANCKSKLKLPKNSEDTYALLQGENYLQEQVTRDAEFKNLKNSLEELYRHRWPQFLKFYKEKITDRNEGILFGQSHALLYGVIEARKERWPSKVVFEAVRQIMVAEIDAMKEPIFYSFSPVYFWRKVAKCRLRGIAVTLIHEARGVEREYRVKMTGQIKAFIRLEFRKPQRLTVRKIINSVLRRFGVELSESSVKSIKNNSHDRNIVEYDSNGVIHGRQNGLPKVIRFLAQSPGDQFQGDWYKLQVYYKDEFNRQKRLWVYVVLDVFSAKVVGWSLCEKILASSAKEAFKMAFTEHHILPEEIIIDNESKYNHPVFKRFVRKLNNLGVIVTKAYPNIPTWKAEIESFFAVFQKLHSDKSWYIGEDIQSKNIAGNPNDEVRKKIYQDVKNMLTRDQLEIEFSKMVKEYNAMTNNRKKKVSPQETYGVASKSIKALVKRDMNEITVWRLNDNGAVNTYSQNAFETMITSVNGWSLHIDSFVVQTLTEARVGKLPNETGGILIGSHDLERKIIYIVDTILSPTDSREYPTSYYRGISGVLEQLTEIDKITAGNLTYMGEWHSHPDNCSLSMSDDDKILFEWISNHMKQIGLPPLMIICGKNDLAMYV